MTWCYWPWTPPGLDIFTTALDNAEQQTCSRLHHGGTIHEFLVTAGAADVEVHDDRVVWRRDHTKAVEILEKLAAKKSGGRGPTTSTSPCRQRRSFSCDEYA